MANPVGGGDHSSRIPKVEQKYRMNYPKRGRFIIFNNTTFNVIGKTLDKRSGSAVDANNLKEIFGKILQFDVEVHNDLTSGQMEHVIRLEAEKNHDNCDCFGVAFLTYEYEKEGMLYGTDCPIAVDRLLRRIKTCKTLFAKPKLCFIQACSPVEKRVMQTDTGGPEADGLKPRLKEVRLPLEADFLYAYSSVPGVYSWTDSERGSWFIEALTDKLTRLAHEDIDLVGILTRVINQVAKELVISEKLDEKVPSITSMLTKDVYFTIKPDSSS